MALPLIAAGAQIVGGLFQGFGARKAKRAAAAKQRAIDARMRELENNRQEIINPFENAANMLSNPFANLQVATQAAEMKAEQADLSLASSLDTLRATGASAGGATALAQAALQSKKGVAASIEMQEAQNEKLRASGEERLQAAQTQEQVRIQGVNIQEGRRMQTADAMGRSFQFNKQEARDNSKMTFLRQSYTTANAGIKGARMAKANAVGQIASSFGSLGDSLAPGAGLALGKELGLGNLSGK